MIEVETVTDGLQFPEGPIAMADGSVILVEMARQTLTRVRPDGARETVAELGGGPNGAAMGPDGAIYVVNNGGALTFPEGWDKIGRAGQPESYDTGYVQRVDIETGKVTKLYDRCDGKPLNAPNDVCFDRQGNMYFTCFGFTDGENRRMGGIYFARPDGSYIERLRWDQISPNGLALSADEKTLYWVDTMQQRISALDLKGPGMVTPQIGHDSGRVVVNLPGWQWPDGIALQADGKICAATLFDHGIKTIDPETGAFEHTPMPDPITTNICFGGPDMQTAWITGSSTGKLFKCRWPKPGLKMAFQDA